MKMRRKSEIRADVQQALDVEVDHRLKPAGFRRRRASDDYVRKAGESVQSILFAPTYHPKLNPNAEVQIYPTVRVEIPCIGVKAIELVGTNTWPPLSLSGMVLNEPIEFLAPFRAGTWYASGKEQIRARIAESVGFVEQWVIARLDSLQSPDDLIRYYEQRKDENATDQSDWYVYVAAAYLLKQNRAAARDILLKHLSDAHLRKRQALALAHLPQILN
jgi:hypothetical protein